MSISRCTTPPPLIQPCCDFFFYLITGIIEDLERLWREICTEDPAYEAEILRGGEVATTLQPRMYHDIQVILSRLVAKAEQLVENVTTNLAESWMQSEI